jgi:cobalt-zinc-cadmium efflux system outer membrane protein
MGSSAVLFLASCAATSTAAPAIHLADLLAEAREKNPEIRADLAEARAAALSIEPQGALDDPKLMVQLWNAPIDFSTVPVMVQLEQMFPLGGKRSARVDSAAAQSKGRAAAADARRLEIEAQVKKTYFDLFMADRTLEVDVEIEQMLRMIARAASARIASGKGDATEPLRAEGEILRLDADRESIAADRAAATAVLSALVDRDSSAPLGKTAVPAIVEKLPTLAELNDRALGARPEIRAADAMIAETGANLRLARAASVPDLGVFAAEMHSFRSSGVADFLFLGFEINLPIFAGSKYEPLAQAAALRTEAAGQRRRALENQIASEIAQAMARLRAEERLVEAHHRLIPLARQALESATASYVAGKGDFLIMLDSGRALQMHEIDLAMHLAKYEQSLADLERAVGVDLGLIRSAESGSAEAH